MAILTADNFAQQIVAQLRILDPSISAEIGTPERKIIDSVAQSLADNQIDLTGLSGALDIDSKFGTNLDQFIALFGFARQVAQVAKGYVIFSRPTPAPADINIPVGTTIQSNTTTSQNQFMQYSTTTGGTIPAGETESDPVLVICAIPGSVGNSAANTLTDLVGVPLPIGVTAVTNPGPIQGGQNLEPDDALKVRFKNTALRNLAGTEDQYLALAVSGAFTAKASVIGAVSKYLEYIQVPDWDDAGNLNGAAIAGKNAAGVAGEWTTALSAIPYAQDIYRNPTPFVSNGKTGVEQYFYRQDVDFIFNYPGQIIGDAFRESQTASTVAPNFTFLNVFNTPTITPMPGLQATAPGDILLSEFRYLSAASRNSIAHNVMNAVDVYIDGVNPTQASCVFLPGVAQFTLATTDAYYVENYRRDGQPATRPIPGNYFTPLFQSPLVSLPDEITVGTTNYYLGVHYWLVHEISLVGGSIRARDGIEWSSYLGADPGGFPFPIDTQSRFDPTVPYNPTGPTFSSLPSSTNVSVENYAYDANVVVNQGAAEAAKQVNTDPLIHRALTRYFKLDVTVMYSANVNYALVNATVGTAVQAFLTNQFFGSVIQLSDLLDVIHQVPGIDNVRWTNDLPNAPNQMRVIETDVNGIPLHTPTLARIISGSGISTETQRLFLPGAQFTNGLGFGDTDSFTLTWNDPSAGGIFTTPVIYLNSAQDASSLPSTPLNAANIQTAIAANAPLSGLYNSANGIAVTADNFVLNPRAPLATFTLRYSQNGSPFLPTVTNLNITKSAYSFDSDFFLHDNELPSLPLNTTVGDTVSGIIIRPRAQNTFTRPGIG